MFPFRIKTDYDLEKLKEDGWEYESFSIKTNDIEMVNKYNEYIYFYEYVRNALFNNAGNKNTSSSFHFQKKIPEASKIVFHIKDGKVYTLPINHISLRLFETKVGILTIELLNYDFKLLEDIFIINDFGRRIYPQFIGKNGINDTKYAFLADKIDLYLDGNKKVTETFKIEDFIRKELKIASYIEYLLGKELRDKIGQIIDDRMYTICWYGDNEFSKNLCKKSSGEYGFESSDDWYRFVYIDGKYIGVGNEKIKKELIKSATYARWVEKGTLFGISRYSFVSVTGESNNIIRNHMRSVYYQMATLLLAQRASIIKFSDDVFKITNQINNVMSEVITKNFKSITEMVRILYSSFIRFVNNIYFEEVTPQEQGIEMYKMAFKIMGLREQMNELRYEIEKLYEFVDMLQEKLIDKGIRLIKVITFLFIAPTLAATIINIGFFSYNTKMLIFHFNIQDQWLFIILTFLILIILFFLYQIGLRRR